MGELINKKELENFFSNILKKELVEIEKVFIEKCRKIEKRVEEIEEKMNKIEEKLNDLECKKKDMKKLEESLKKIDKLERKIQKIEDNLDNKINEKVQNMISENVKKFLEILERFFNKEEVNNLKNEISKKNEKIEELDKIINSKESEIQDLRNEINNLKDKISVKTNNIKNLNQTIDMKNSEINSLKREIENLKDKISKKEIEISNKNKLIKNFEDQLEKEKENCLKEQDNLKKSYEKELVELKNINLENENKINELEKYREIFKDKKLLKLLNAILKNEMLAKFREDNQIVDNSPKSIVNLIKLLKDDRTFVTSIYDYILKYKQSNPTEMSDKEIEFYNAVNEYFNKEVFFNIYKKVKEDRFDKSIHRGINGEIRGEFSDDKLVLIPSCKVDNIKMRVKMK